MVACDSCFQLGCWMGEHLLGDWRPWDTHREEPWTCWAHSQTAFGLGFCSLNILKPKWGEDHKDYCLYRSQTFSIPNSDLVFYTDNRFSLPTKWANSHWIEKKRGRSIWEIWGRFTDPKEEGQGNHHAESPKCLDYIRKSLWGRESPAPGLEGSGQRAGHASHVL